MGTITVIQGVMNSIMSAAGFDEVRRFYLPDEVSEAIEACGFFESIPL